MRYVAKLGEIPIYDAPLGAPPRSVATMIDTNKSDELTMGIFVLPPGRKSVIDYHDQDEAYFLTRGTGQELLWLHGGDKDPEQFEIEAGSAVFIPRSVRHQTSTQEAKTFGSSGSFRGIRLAATTRVATSRLKHGSRERCRLVSGTQNAGGRRKDSRMFNEFLKS
jgi:mannose-6-phosphate isomerase-like protein (cupin superfamily)